MTLLSRKTGGFNTGRRRERERTKGEEMGNEQPHSRGGH
jgi:hypothetical protein